MTATTMTTQGTFTPSKLLRQVFVLDGAGCVGLGVAMVPLAGWLETTLGLPALLIYALAAYLAAYGAAEVYVGTRPRAGRSTAVTLIALNAMFVLDSAIVLATGWFSPTTAGAWTLALTAAGVAAVTAVQAVAYRRS